MSFLYKNFLILINVLQTSEYSKIIHMHIKIYFYINQAQKLIQQISNM